MMLQHHDLDRLKIWHVHRRKFEQGPLTCASVIMHASGSQQTLLQANTDLARDRARHQEHMKKSPAAFCRG
jgi:hypothetical protein